MRVAGIWKVLPVGGSIGPGPGPAFFLLVGVEPEPESTEEDDEDEEMLSSVVSGWNRMPKE
jgi:hypothetical protein